MGSLYSRCIGSLKSKGKYIFPLDGDDMFLAQGVFYFVYNEIKKINSELLYFRGISVGKIEDFFNCRNLNIFRNYKINTIMFQPSISLCSYKQCSLQAQCIKSSLYKTAINSYGKKKWTNYITFREDCIINFIILQFTTSCILFLKVGYLHIFRASSNSHSESSLIKLKCEIYYLRAKYDFSNLLENKVLAVKDLLKLSEQRYFNKILGNKQTKNILNSFSRKIIYDRITLDKNDSLLLNRMLKVTRLYKKYI